MESGRVTLVQKGYKIVQLAGGVHSVHSLAHGETFHPVIGPVAEAEALYVRQIQLPARMAAAQSEFVVWDVGLGAAANALTVIRGAAQLNGRIHMISFDDTIEPIEFALAHSDQLEYLRGFEPLLRRLQHERTVRFTRDQLTVQWDLHLADFPSLVRLPASRRIPKPHLILYDAYSPSKNPAMWSAPLFSDLNQLLDPARPCLMPTYSRSTMLRVSLLVAGFYVGIGHATGEKEETTIAANSLDLLENPLGERWLERARQSKSAEPLWTPDYRQAPLSSDTWVRLKQHPQFNRRGQDLAPSRAPR